MVEPSGSKSIAENREEKRFTLINYARTGKELKREKVHCKNHERGQTL